MLNESHDSVFNINAKCHDKCFDVTSQNDFYVTLSRTPRDDIVDILNGSDGCNNPIVFKYNDVMYFKMHNRFLYRVAVAYYCLYLF